MDEPESGFIQLELKYCERCGGLWLRLRGSDAVFCSGCARAMAGLPRKAAEPARSERSMDLLAPPSRWVPDTRGSADERLMPVFWSEGGNA